MGRHLQWNQSNVIRSDLGFGNEGASFGVTALAACCARQRGASFMFSI